MEFRSFKQKIIRLGQRIFARVGLDVRLSRRYNFGFWSSLPGGLPRTLLDIGGNEGQFAKGICLSLPNCTVHSFEPLRQPYFELQKLAKYHLNLKCHNIALGDVNGSSTIHTGGYTASSSLLKPTQHLVNSLPQVVPNQSENIKVMRLDDWIGKVSIELPLFIKLDVQGYELQVIRGGCETIRRASGVLMELSFVELYEGQPLIRDVIETMHSMGFRLADIYEVSRDPSSGLGFQCDGLFLPIYKLKS